MYIQSSKKVIKTLNNKKTKLQRNSPLSFQLFVQKNFKDANKLAVIIWSNMYAYAPQKLHYS